MCTTANYIKEVCTKITSRSANKNFISIQSILLTKKKKKWKPWHSSDIFYFLCTTSHSCCNQMTCEKPSCKTPAERKQVRQRGDGLSRIRIQQAINRSIFLKVQMKCMQFTLKTNIYNSFFFFFFLNQICYITNTSEKHGEREKTKTGFALSALKHFWSYRIITYIHYFRDRSTYWRESEIWPGILLLLLSSDGYVINIFSIAWLHISVLRLSKLWRRKRWVCGFFLFLWLH